MNISFFFLDLCKHFRHFDIIHCQKVMTEQRVFSNEACHQSPSPYVITQSLTVSKEGLRELAEEQFQQAAYHVQVLPPLGQTEIQDT